MISIPKLKNTDSTNFFLMAGPCAIEQQRLDQMIRRVIAAAASPGPTVH